MNEFKTAVIAALVGAIASGVLSFVVNEKSLKESRKSQQQEINALSIHWKETNSKTDEQLNLMTEANLRIDNQLTLMKINIEEMRKSYIFEQERHRAEMEAVYRLIEVSSKNTDSIIAQQAKLATEKKKRTSE